MARHSVSPKLGRFRQICTTKLWWLFFFVVVSIDSRIVLSMDMFHFYLLELGDEVGDHVIILLQ